MTEVDRLLDQLRRDFDGDAWSGPSLIGTLDGLGAGPAAAHPWPGTHSIHEIVLHLTSWTHIVARRVESRQNLPLAAENWPAARADEAAWSAAQAGLRRAHEQLLAAAASSATTSWTSCRVPRPASPAAPA